MVKYCPKCGKSCKDDDTFCMGCGFDFNNVKMNQDPINEQEIQQKQVKKEPLGNNKEKSTNNLLNKRNIIIIAVALIVIVCIGVGVYAISSSNDNSIPTHKITLNNEISFNISNELTNSTNVNHLVGEGMSYKNKDNVSFTFGGLADEGYDTSHLDSQRDVSYHNELDSMKTPQGFNVYIFENDVGSPKYDAYIEINYTSHADGVDCHYTYFWVQADSLDELKIIVNTFMVLNVNSTASDDSQSDTSSSSSSTSSSSSNSEDVYCKYCGGYHKKSECPLFQYRQSDDYDPDEEYKYYGENYDI